MHINFSRSTIVSVLLLSGILAKAEFHEFELNDGRKVKAEVVKYNRSSKQVALKREDGKIVRVNIDIFVNADQEYILKWKKPPEGMVLIPAGTNSGTDPDFGEYSVTVNGLFMDQYEVTKQLWDSVYRWAVSHGYDFDNKGEGIGSDHPVQTVSWYDCVKWCNARSQMENRKPCYTVDGKIYIKGQYSPECDLDGNGYRLPTCNEWEYAARGGLQGKRFPWGDTISHKLANYNARKSYDYDESQGGHPEYMGKPGVAGTSPVGVFDPNNYGLYDMVGNINEWCWNESDGKRCVRGCSNSSAAAYGRCGADNDYFDPTTSFNGFGFRTVCN